MKLKTLMTWALLIVSAASVSGCTVPLTFCEAVPSPIEFDKETARQVVKTDRAEAVQIAAQNALWSDNCR